METLKEKYELIKTQTIDRFFNLISTAVAFFNSPDNNSYDNVLKDSFDATKIKQTVDSVSFNFLYSEVVLIYSINPNGKTFSTIVEAYKQIPDKNNYPNYKLERINDLDFSFSAKSNVHGFKNYIFEGKEYCVANDARNFFNAYIKKAQDILFPSI